MGKKVLFIILTIGGIMGCTMKAPQLGKASLDEIVKAMTLEEKVSFVIGTGMPGFSGNAAVVGANDDLVPGAAGTTYPIPRLGIPAIVIADGPAGVRISPVREGDENTYYCTAFPIGTLLASTWNTDLVENVGKAMGNEALEYDVDVLLGPALNIHRNPLNGRNFEYYSEDPVVSGKITSAIIKGVQSNGVGTSVKHFAANNQETNRTNNDSRVTPRALREIYLKGFEIGIKESAPWTVMSSYNRINGVYAPESYDLLTTILRDEWGYNGVVMTDWFGGEIAPAMIHAGNDLLMPGTDKQAGDILAAVKDGSLAEADLDLSVKRILELIVASPSFKGYTASNKPDLAAHAAVTRQSAAEGMVLLKNNGALPFSGNVKKLALYGITSYDFISGGKGSGDVNSAYTVSLEDGLTNAGYQIDEQLKSVYKNYLNKIAEEEAAKPKDNPLAAFIAHPRPEELTLSMTRHAVSTDMALITIGRISGEFLDRTLPANFELTANEQKLINDVTQAFHRVNKKVVVVLNVGGVIETASWKNKPDAILLAWQAGQEGGNSVSDVLSGKVNPSGKLTMSFPVKYMDVSSARNFPYDYVIEGDIVAAMMSRNTSAEPKRNIDYTVYEEDIYVGYRYFDTFKKEVSYPFGYGLSYTTFAYNNPKVAEANGVFTVTVDVKNSGKVKGKEVVQLYVAAPENQKYKKPVKELKAFAKTKELAPGETQTVSLSVNAADLASFDEENSQWVADKGKYSFHIGASLHDIKGTVNAELQTTVEQKVNNVLGVKEPIKVLAP